MSARFLKIYNSLPPEAQQILIENHLAGLLDAVSKEKSKKVMLAATRLQTKHSKTPELNLRAKKKQIGELLEDLAKDAKIAIVPERSRRDELLSEIIHGLLSWLNDIWSVVYEQNVQFATAHRCLLFVAEALIQLSERSTLGGCKCAFINLPIRFTLKDNNGKVLRRFSVRGPQKMDQILLWIWRDLFVSLLATASKRDKTRVPEFLEEIEDVLGINSMARLLRGGRLNGDGDDDDGWEDEGESYSDFDEEDEDEGEDEDEDEDDDEGEDEYTDDGSDGSDARCGCNLHARYWTHQMNHERIPLRDCVEKRLITIFKQTPSWLLYRTLTSINVDSHRIEDEIFGVLQKIAGNSPDNLVAALDIYIHDVDLRHIVDLLEKHIHLLRPRDMVTLQCAVGMLVESPQHRPLALSIFENEIGDALQAIYVAVRASFIHIEEAGNKAELAALLKQPNSPGRKTRIESWAEKVISSSSNSMGPMAFAAMMMGLPVMPDAEDGDHSDILDYFDLDRNDSDLDDLRDEFRPDLKARFDGWVKLGQSGMTGGRAILMKQYAKAIDLMPFLQSPEIVIEMVDRMKQEGPAKQHVVDALTNLGAFAKIQRKKINLAAEKNQRNGTAATAGASGSNGGLSKNATRNKLARSKQNSSRSNAGPSLRPSFPKVPGGMEDVD